MSDNAIMSAPETIRDLVNVLGTDGYVLEATGSAGIHVKLTNGFIVSIQCGPSNYGSNKTLDLNEMWRVGVFGENRSPEHWFAAGTAEVAVLGPSGALFQMPEADDVVFGWQTPERILYIIEAVERLRVTLPA